MFTIAICDDEPSICAELERMVLDYAQNVNLKVDVQVYYSGEELSIAVSSSETCPDLIFLDIELRIKNGIEIGRLIRDDLKNEIVQIVYISGKQRYAMKLFDMRPLHFLVKPLEKEKVCTLIRKAWELVNAQNSVFEFQEGRRFYRIPYHDIVYFENYGKRVLLVTESREYMFYGKLCEVMIQAPKDYFIQIHQSYSVNYLYISIYQYDGITLVSGKTLSVSQTYQKAVRQKILEIRRRRNGG